MAQSPNLRLKNIILYLLWGDCFGDEDDAYPDDTLVAKSRLIYCITV